jgi:hypothetical protein
MILKDERVKQSDWPNIKESKLGKRNGLENLKKFILVKNGKTS